MGSKKAAAAIYGIVTASSVAISLANLAGSLRILDLTSSTLYLSVSVTLYNLAYTLMSWGWTFIFFGRVSRRGIIVISFGGIAAGLTLMALGQDVAVVILGTALVGLFSAVVSPLLTTILTDFIGWDAAAVNRYNIFSSIGLAVGYLLGVFLRPYVGTDTILALTAATVATTIPLAFLIPYKYVAIEPRRVTYVSLIPQFTGKLRPLPSILFSPEIIYNLRRLIIDFQRIIKDKLVRRLPLTLVATGALFLGISVFFTPLPAFLRNVGFRDEELYLIYMYSTVVSTLSYMAVHKHVRKASHAWKPLIIAVSSRIPIFMLPTILLYHSTLKALAVAIIGTVFTLVGVSWAYISTSLPTIILSMSETERRAERLGHMNAAVGVGTILGSLIAGIAYQAGGYLGVFTTSAGFIAVATALYLKAWKALVT
ncbi:MAG: MFS transporter [Desulfurococcales archaeon]|nr:MFS transporter [Desulfurococcales archaeon]